MTTDTERQGLPSASGIEALMLCPGKWQAERGLPEDTTMDAERGTEAHKAFESGETERLEVAQQDRVKVAEEICQRYFERWLEDFHIDREHVVEEREQREWLPDRKGNPIMSGKSDRVYRAKNYALVVDFKSGWGDVVPPFNNWQLRSLAVLQYYNHGVSYVRVVIVQPTKTLPCPCDYESGDLDRSLIHLRGLLMAVLNDSAAVKRNPGVEQCKFCRARATCPEAIAASMAVVPSGLSLERGSKVNLDWKIQTPERKLELFKAAKLMGKVADYIERKVKEELAENPSAIPGLNKKPDGQTRVISNVLDLYRALREEAADSPSFSAAEFDAKFISLCSVSVGDAEEFARKLMPELGPKDAAKWLNESGAVSMKPRSGAVEMDPTWMSDKEAA